ncbi:MAG: glutamyl-tRNA reductase [Hymenobacteraceae bacterium]|nr:glutamyl-tRNA reductase [Hymenobacteraceae bacterium]MDX5395330.1 glutamyl-tRNA reductase [Hymenobacteraceae bacterium]MDX5442772.1 glutamyl-tRNA reductase [Hymenobacteraceae bacterium]MDX5511377.1 glutamyl-tRNA reductase [Hymenobacteraceae bacterium]
MQNQFKALTLSYKHAPIAVREAVSLNEIACKNLLDKIKEFTAATDVLVLSTCNRTEVYYASEKDLSREIVKLIALEKGFFATKEIYPYFKHISKPELAVKHLFNVGLGLESQVVGDFQILNQVKKAYQWSADAGMAGPFLHRLLHTIFYSNKRVSNETAFRDGAASVSYATVELVEELTRKMENPRVLMIGIGEIGADVCDNFQKSAINNIVLVNRTHHKALELAQKTNATAVYWENVWEEIAKADVVISSVPGDCFFISKELVEQLNPEQPKFFLDLSIPRSIDNEIAMLADHKVYNIDNIRNRATEALEHRLAAIPMVEQIVEEAMAEFNTWTKEMAMSPALQQFKNRLEEIRQQEIARYLKKMDAGEKEMIEMITANILNKIVKLPALELKAACLRNESDALVEGLQALFSLEKQEA